MSLPDLFAWRWVFFFFIKKGDPHSCRLRVRRFFILFLRIVLAAILFASTRFPFFSLLALRMFWFVSPGCCGVPIFSADSGVGRTSPYCEVRTWAEWCRKRFRRSLPLRARSLAGRSRRDGQREAKKKKPKHIYIHSGRCGVSCRRCADAANEDAECRELWINHRLSDSSSSMLSNLVVPSLSSTSPSSSSLRADRLTADQRSARRNAPRKRNYTTPTELDREPTILESEQKQQKKTKKKQNSPRSISVSAEGRVSSRVDSHRHMVQFQNWRPVLFFFPVVFFYKYFWSFVLFSICWAPSVAATLAADRPLRRAVVAAVAAVVVAHGAYK